MKLLLILFLSISIIPVLAQGPSINQTEYQKLEKNIADLHTDHTNSDRTSKVYFISGALAGFIVAVIFFKAHSDQSDKIKKIISEQEKFKKEQHDFVINRARSYLGSLHSSITSLMNLDIDPNIPESKEMDRLLDFKNQMVTQLDYIVTQSGSILEQDYLQRLTDIIVLSRVNPKPSSNNDVNLYLDVEYCPGIISQIEDLLKIMSNPPI